MLYSIAGLVIDINFKYDYGKNLCRRYKLDTIKKADFCVEATPQMIENERKLDIYGVEDGILESLAVYRYICEKAYDYDCMFMHCSALSYKGNGVLFTAPSGTGKSTHSALWRKHFADDVVMVNDDKPLLRFIDGELYVCGTPWDGKHHISNNICVPVKAIVVLSQGAENEVERADKREAVYNILNQTIRPKDGALMSKVLDFTEKIIESIPVYKLKCNISEQAVETVYGKIKENFNED